MPRRVLRASPLAIAVTAVIAAVSVVGFVLTKNSADQQEKTLLESNASQASLYVSSVFSGIGSTLDSLATAVTLTNGSPTAFAERAKVLAQGQISLVLAHDNGAGNYVVQSAVGPSYSAGQTLPADLSASLAKAGVKLSPGPVIFNGKSSTASFAAGPPLLPPGDAVFMAFSLNPFLASPVTAAKPFASLRVAVYGSSTADQSHLLVATSNQLPLTGQTVTDHPAIGSGTWTLVASARSPLIGSFAKQAPYIILLLGILVALVVAGTVEILVRRQRYAAQAVAERTADLNQSLADLREAQDALVRGERLTALGEMASVVGHELRNPLAAVTNALYLLRRNLGEPADAAYEKHLAMAERETGKAATLAEDLTAFVRPREPQKETVPVRELVDEVVETTPPPAGVDLQLDVAPLSVEVDRRQLGEVLTNLVTNAYQAVGDGGTVRIRAAAIDSIGVELSVQDSGPGLDAGVADRVFEPFFTTKHDGTGLGLAIVRRLVEAHGGEVSFDRADGDHGAKVVVRIPGEVGGTSALHAEVLAGEAPG
jgi:signal transduction histidine kinase